MQEDKNKLNYFNDTEQGYFDELQTRLGNVDGNEEAAAFVNIDQLCEKYNQIRGTLELALTAVEKIPGIGKKIAKAIRFLMTVADIACSGDGDTSNLSATTEGGESGFSLNLEQIEALNRLETAVDNAAGSSFASSNMITTANFDKEEICRQYRKVRKFITPVLPIIGLIPGVGGTIVTAVNILMAIADSVCGEG